MSEKEYIEREKAVGIAHGYCHTIYGTVCGPDDVVELYEELKSIPAADVVEVIHAHWVKPTKIGGRSVDVPHCSHCKEIPCGVDMNTHYCPNCGAKMDAEEAETT